MTEPELGMVTHADYVGTNIDDQTLLLFRRKNPAEAQFVILASEHYLELIRAAADGRIRNKALQESAAILREIFDTCPTAADIYLKILGKGE